MMMAKLHLMKLNNVKSFERRSASNIFVPVQHRQLILFCFVLFALLHRYTPLLPAIYAGTWLHALVGLVAKH